MTRTLFMISNCEDTAGKQHFWISYSFKADITCQQIISTTRTMMDGKHSLLELKMNITCNLPLYNLDPRPTEPNIHARNFTPQPSHRYNVDVTRQGSMITETMRVGSLIFGSQRLSFPYLLADPSILIPSSPPSQAYRSPNPPPTSRQDC